MSICSLGQMRALFVYTVQSAYTSMADRRRRPLSGIDQPLTELRRHSTEQLRMDLHL